MRLRLNLSDVDLQLKMKYPHFQENDGYDWTQTELALHSRYINYDINGEILMEYEVSDLCHALESLVDGTMESDCHIRFAEPDLEFEFYTAKRLYSVPGKIIYTKGYCDVDIHLDMFINFWRMGGLGSNQFKMVLSRHDIDAFATYLKTVSGELKANDPHVIYYINQGMILPE